MPIRIAKYKNWIARLPTIRALKGTKSSGGPYTVSSKLNKFKYVWGGRALHSEFQVETCPGGQDPVQEAPPPNR